MAALLAGFDTSRFSKRIWKVVSAVACFFISISTVFLKQHSIIDVIAAVALCAVGYVICYKLIPDKTDRNNKVKGRKEYEKVSA